MEKKRFQQLSKDEMGKLHGGFTISPISLKLYNSNKNENCDNNGTEDSNKNCKCRCGGSQVIVTPPPVDQPIKTEK